MKKTSLSLLFLLIFSTCWAQQQYRKPVKPVKNVILMIPDGTSIGVVSAARWYQIYNKLGGDRLAIDPYICGTVKTYSSNAPIGDSAPTTACYMTGVPQKTGNISIYPEADPGKDLIPLDATMAYQPLVTILEAAKIEKNKATGLVVTVEFPHATPADCASHHYNRKRYDYLGSQMAYNNLDVMFGGGNKLITDDIKQHFQSTNTKLIQGDVAEFRAYNSPEKRKIWALFSDMELPFDLDRNPAEAPSLAEMTEKAITELSKDENGFFLMVEGSMVDWRAHGNDAVGCITEYLSFDRAVQVAMDFAKKNGETAVIIMPDHGNSGFSIGNRKISTGYDVKSLDDLFRNVSQYKKTAVGMEKLINEAEPDQFKSIFKEYTNIDLTDEEENALVQAKGTHEGNYMESANSVNLGHTITDIMNDRTFFGFTTGGHSGEEVFLAAYHPQGDIPVGMNTNIEMNNYLFDVVGLQMPLPERTKEVFAKHQDVFTGLKCTIDKSTDFPVLTVKKGKNTLVVPAFKSVAYLNGKPIDLNSVTVYIDKNDTFYLPSNLAEKLN